LDSLLLDKVDDDADNKDDHHSDVDP
jgi:hypothetical protein